MKIWLARIPEEGSHYDGVEPSSIMELEEDAFIKVSSDVRYELYAQHISDEVIVRGTLELDIDLKCTRCAEFFSTTVTYSDFLRAYPASKDIDSVDITEDMRENLLLHIPAFPVCSKECKGLCAQCGADLNKVACDCEAGERPNPWLALDNLDL